MTGLRYVYAICRPFDAALQSQLTGVGGTPPGLLRHHGLVAVVSTVPEGDFAELPLRAHLADPDWRSATGRAHQGVIDALTTVTTPLPLRPATVFRDDSAVRVMIEEREDDFRRTLDRLEGRVEWGVKVFLEPEPEPSDQRHEDRWRTAEEFANRLHTLLSRHAEESRLHAPQNAAPSGDPGENVLNGAYLVPRSRSEEFVELVDRTKDEAPGMRVELTGPWAAYSFTDDLSEEER
ncbi:GvpL/GvpF family gas vesicle protein [Streptomyces sp. NPDC050625]|uniref:GvpL/GvpF family gas vesicle protein n=1 Tax=Streptomyces sp. NPDC050625 TaxID=3154629 RepID=UPI00343F53A3